MNLKRVKTQVIQFDLFSSIWRSLGHLKGSLNHPKKVTKNCQNSTFSLTYFSFDQCPNPTFPPEKIASLVTTRNEVLYLAELEASEPPAKHSVVFKGPCQLVSWLGNLFMKTPYSYSIGVFSTIGRGKVMIGFLWCFLVFGGLEYLSLPIEWMRFKPINMSICICDWINVQWLM